MRSSACVVLGAWVGLLGCRSTQAFLAPALTNTRAAYHQQPCRLQVRNNNRLAHSSSRAMHMSGNDENKPAAAAASIPEVDQPDMPSVTETMDKPEEVEQPSMPNVTEMMDKAAEANFVARASASSSGGVMGPARQPEEYKRKERENFELNKPKENKWASGAMKRGIALQAVVLSFVIYLSLQPEEVNNLSICAPFTHVGGCVGFGEWVEIVFLGAPIPPM